MYFDSMYTDQMPFLDQSDDVGPMGNVECCTQAIASVSESLLCQCITNACLFAWSDTYYI